jgi:hypothetical protein
LLTFMGVDNPIAGQYSARTEDCAPCSDRQQASGDGPGSSGEAQARHARRPGVPRRKRGSGARVYWTCSCINTKRSANEKQGVYADFCWSGDQGVLGVLREGGPNTAWGGGKQGVCLFRLRRPLPLKLTYRGKLLLSLVNVKKVQLDRYQRLVRTL